PPEPPRASSAQPTHDPLLPPLRIRHPAHSTDHPHRRSARTLDACGYSCLVKIGSCETPVFLGGLRLPAQSQVDDVVESHAPPDLVEPFKIGPQPVPENRDVGLAIF